MSDRPTVVIGGSGAMGLPTVRHLVKRGARIRALTSSERSAARLRSLGVAETVVGDFRRESDLCRVMDGAGPVLFNPPRFTADEAEIGRGVIAAARVAGAERLVLNSVLHPELRDLPHHCNKLTMQEELLNSGLAFVILQPAMYMQNLAIEWPNILAEGTYSRPYSFDRKQALVDTDDLGEAAAMALSRTDLLGGTYELCGPAPLTQREMATIIGEELGRTVIAVRREPEDWRAWAEQRGWKPWAIETYLTMCRHYDEHGYAGGSPVTLRAILGREPADYRSFVRRFIADRA